MPMTRILWVTGRLPVPLHSGDALYTAGLIRAIAACGVSVTAIGAKRQLQSSYPILVIPGVTWIEAQPATRKGAVSLLASLPKDAYISATPELRTALLERLSEVEWNWIVIDHANTGGLLPEIRKRKKGARLAYVAHNAEGLIRPQIAARQQAPLRFIMSFDAAKYRRLENHLVQASDAIICITPEDRAYFTSRHTNVFVVPPVYQGPQSDGRIIDTNRPRRILLLGSFDWIAKRNNLVRIVSCLHPYLVSCGITLDVVGSVPSFLREELGNRYSNITFHGAVSDPGPYLATARGGLAAEEQGGGFKLKILDYAFNGVPVFALQCAIAGFSAQEKKAMFIADSIDQLGGMIATTIEDLEELNSKQRALAALVRTRFYLRHTAQLTAEVFLNGTGT